MRTLAFLSQKGGSGKTTLALHCAVAAMEDGKKVTVADTDPQELALGWSVVRGTDRPPEVIRASAHEVAGDLSQSPARGLLIVDSQGHAAPEIARLAKAATVVVIPCRPTALDVSSVLATVGIVQAVSARAVFVLSACPHHAPEIADTRAYLSEFSIPVFPGQITDRRSFARAIATGRAVTEFETHSKAAEEIRALWRWLEQELKNGKK